MRTRKLSRWVVLPLAALIVLTIGSQTGRPQADSKTPPPRIDVDLPPITPTPPRAPAPAPTVDDLINQLEQLRKQKAELEEKEKLLVGQLQGRLKNQTERLTKLGVITPPPPSKEDVKPVDAIFPPMPPGIIPPITAPEKR